MTCRTCKHLKVQPDAAGRIVPRKANAYRCGAMEEVPPPVLPHSVTRGRDFRWPPHSRYMTPDEGEGCPLFTKR